MPGQGITVSILAKIEGWLDLIKLILSALKNIKPGSDLSKGLIKDLQQVEGMINNLGKNMNLRLTSDSLINHFVDRMTEVELIFNHIGTSMSAISFKDINPDYITAGFKDLISTLELANNALGTGMEASFLNAIANSKNLLKEFANMKIDPKTMNMDAIREAVAERGKILEKDVQEGLKNLSDFEKGLKKIKNTRDELAARDKFIGTDVQLKSLALLMGLLPTLGTILDELELLNKLDFFRANLLRVGFSPSELKRIIPDLQTVMEAGNWDEMPNKFTEYLREAQNRTRNSLAKASQDYRDAVAKHTAMSGALNRLSALKFNNTLAQNEISNIITGPVLAETKSLKDTVNNLRLELEKNVTSSFHGLGSKLFGSSQQGMQDASAAMKDYTAALDLVRAKELALGKVQGIVLRYFSIYAAVRMVSNAIRSMMNNIRELDKTITEIAIVTKMDQNDLWGLMPQYTKLAKNYAASISGVYQVSLLYYQQGLGLSDVMALTELTLKMARISGLDYAQATDYMTNAVRSFKMEMTDAANVVDVYSAIAAASASSVTELASAMSKTASSALAVGSSFENTTAMMAVMIEATRESAENIGSAMKSIISRYGEMTSDPSKLVDSEGLEMSLNRVDKALLTVGISIHNSAGEFRNFDDVIMELAEKWDTIDTNTLRYIATIMAGNRQQSRFLALVSSYDRLKELSETAANSEDASLLLFLKTMDSIEAKTQLFKTSLLSLYTSSGIEKLYKGLLDFGNDFATTLENISGKSGLVGAIANVGAGFTNMATLATTSFGIIKSRFLSTKQKIEYESKLAGALERANIALTEYDNIKENRPSALLGATPEELEKYEKLLSTAQLNLKNANTDAKVLKAENNARMAALNKTSKLQGWGMAASAAGMALGAWANSVDINQNRGLKSGLTMGSSALSGLGTGLMVGASAGGPIGALVGGLTALPGIILGIGMLSESVTERIQKLDKNVTDAKNERIKSKDELKTLTDYKKKYDELNKSLYDSVEKKKEFVELSNLIAEAYPELVKSMDAEGNYVISMAEGYEKLAEAKRNAYREDIIDSIKAETAGLQDADYVLTNIYNLKPLQNLKNITGWWDTSSILALTAMDYTTPENLLSAVADLFKDKKGALTANTIFDMVSSWGYNNNTPNEDWIAKNVFGASWTLVGKDNKNLDRVYLVLSDEGADALSLIYIDFIKEIQDDKGYTEAVKNLQEKYSGKEDYIDAINRFNPTAYKELYIRLNLPEYQELLINNRISAYNDELINLFSDSTEDIYHIASNDILKRFASQEITSDFKKWFKELDQEVKDDPEKYKEAVKTFYDQYTDLWYYTERQSDYLNTLTEEDNQFYKNLDLYTLEDVRQKYQKRDLTNLEGIEKYLAELLNKRADAIEAIFQLDYGTITKLYEDWAKENKSQGVADYSQKVGAGYLSEILSKYLNILANTSLSGDEIENLITGLNGILDIITDPDKFNFEQRNALLTRFKVADLTSLFGIYNFIDQILQLDIGLNLEDQQGLVDLIKNFSNFIHINFITEVSSYIDSLENALEGMDTDISNATKGMNVKKAHQLATNLGKHLSDFTIRDGKFYYDLVNDIIAYYDKTDTEYQEALLERIDNYNKLKELFDAGGVSAGTANVKDHKENFSLVLKQAGISFDEFEQLYNSFLKLLNSEDGIKNFFDYLESITSAETEAVSNFITLLNAITSLLTISFDAFWEAANLSKFDDQKEAVLLAAKALDFSSLLNDKELYKAITPYIGTLLSFFKDVNSTVVNTLIDLVGTGKKANITVTSANRDYLKDLQGKGLFEGVNFDDNSIIGQLVSVLVDTANGIEEIIRAEIALQFTTDAEQLEAYLKYHTNKYKNNKLNNFSKLTGNTITYDDFTNYLSQNLGMSAKSATNSNIIELAMDSYGLAMDSAGNFYVLNWSQRIRALNTDLLNILSKENASPEEINAARANLEIAKRGQQEAIKTAGKDIIKNYLDISTNLKEVLANALGEDSALLEKYYIEENGVLKLNLPEFKKELESSTSKIPEYLRTLFLGMFNDIADEYLKDINSSVELVTKGTSSQVDILAFKDKAAALGIDITNSNFSFDAIANAWTLDPAKMYEYVKKLGEKLIADGLMAQELLNDYIKANVSELIAATVDIDSFLQAENRGELSLARQKLTKQLKDWATLHWHGVEPNERTLTDWIADIEGGGQEAVDLALLVAADAGKELSSEQITSYYYAQINRLLGFADSIANLTKGSYVAEGEFRTILLDVGMVDSDGVVTSVEKAAAAYKEIYDRMGKTGEQTASSLNKVYALYLTETERGDIDAIEVMGNAMGMTYDALGTLLGRYGKELETWLRQNTGLYEKIGAGKIRITDFSRFASSMGWLPGSEEYTSAFKTYNDSLIELNNKTEKSIFDEIKNISDANIGDLINLTQAYTAIEKFERHDMQDFVYSLRDLGAEFSDGILTLSDNANIPMIIKAIAEEALKAGGLIPELLASLNDVLIETLSKIANLIKSGISGTLSNVDAHNLSGWAESVGIDKLDFVKTTDGLKLALDSAIELYTKLNLIDSLQGKLVFDELNKSLQESNEHYKSISDIANRIAWIEDETHPERAQLYALELALAKEILAVRSTTEDSSFNFMSNKIPGAQNNPINYFENWASAIHTFNDALKTPGTYTKNGKSLKSGLVDYDYWYNLVTEMNNIAGIGQDIEFAGVTLDGSLERASELILKGADSLVVTDTGEVKVALKGMALDFSSGANAFSGDVTAGIQAMAKSLVEMLDGMILLLETVVAMEKLGDITGGDNTIDLTDLFPKFTSDTDKQILNDIAGFNDFVKAAGDNLDTIVINGEKLSDTIKRALTEGLNKAEAENFTAIMNSLYLMYRSGEYNLDNIYDSIQEIMAASDFSGTIQLGDNTLIIQKGTTILLTKDGKYQANGKTYDTLDAAIATATVDRQGGGGEAAWNDTTKTAKKTIHIKSLDMDVEIESGADGKVSFNDELFNSLDEYILHCIDADPSLTQEEKILKKIDVGLELGTVKLDSFTYNSIDDTIKKELEEALASGQQAKVDAVIEAHPVLSLLKGLTGEEISKLLGLDSIKTTVDNSLALEAINAVEKALSKLTDKTITITTVEKTVSDKTSSGGRTSDTSLSKPRVEKSFVYNSTGNIGLAQSKGTLMGELGPELVVSDGRYFVAGQNGPEMVELADDAIVFNHLQTKSLLEKGTSPGRGKAITNERNAVAFATGNVNGGPAMASASAALAALKQLRAQWNALAGLSVQDLAGKGGGGGGGGGGDSKSFIKDLERWYNWLQQIALLEKEINLEEAKRSRYLSSMISMGREYADSQLVTIDKLKQQIAVLESLNRSQEAYFEKRRKELNENSAFKALYQFDENGQLKYKPGQFEWLSNLVGRDSVTGEANYTAKEQYDMLVAAGYGELMKYDSSGAEIKQDGDNWQVTAVQAFWDKIEAERQEMQSLHDDVLEGQVKEEELMTNLNEILNAIEDNLIAVEDKVLKAIEETRLREIDAILDEKDAIEKSSQALINGLSDLLSKEQDMYSRQLDSNELSRLQRLLSILQRSGGSASLIASLQKDITERLQDAYFDELKAQIDALLEASDNQLQKLQEQIDLMTELLAYEKEHGMLWEQVYQVMALSPEYITEFITKNTEEYWGKSPADFAEDSRDVLFQAEQFVLMREKVEGGLAALVAANSPEAIAAESEKITAESETQLSADLTPENITPTSTPSSGSELNKGATGPRKKYVSDGPKGHHWEYTNDEGRLIKGGITAHTFNNKGICTVCGYRRSTTGGGCFVAGTLIIMADGTYCNIENIHVDDIVLAYNDLNGQFEKRKVTKSYIHHNTPKVLQIILSNNITLGITPGHPILTTAGWKSRDIENSLYEHGVYAEWLEIGDTVIGYNGNALVISINELNISEHYDTYNIEVETCHTFIADGIVVHNMKVAEPPFASGGLDTFTGTAMLHGTPLKPEAVLNPEQTRVLREEILSNKPTSLLSLLTDFRDAYENLSSASAYNTTNNDGVLIQLATVEMHVSRIANDYDAQRAGELALDQMLAIARRTQAQNRVGR